MKVVCIDESGLLFNDKPKVKKGMIYNVIESSNRVGVICRGIKSNDGIYYKLAETGGDIIYHNSLFIEIIENNIDETELVNQKQETY